MIMTIEDIINQKGPSYADAADLFGVDQITIGDVLSGTWRKFTIDMLIIVLARAGVMVELTMRTNAAA